LFNPINIAGFTGLTFKGFFGAGSKGNSRYDNFDYIIIEAKIDNRSFFNRLAFLGQWIGNDIIGYTSGDLIQDSDLNGSADGIALAPGLQEFSFGVSTGSLVQFRIRFSMNSVNEEIAFDNFRLVSATLPLDIKVFFEGSYNSGSMTTNLVFGGILPSTQPYNTSPWNYSGSEVISNDLYANGIAYSIVDWVLVELRDKTNPSTVISTRAAFLMQDSTITDMDGTNPVKFDIILDSYYVSVHHRNHLPIMSANPVSLSIP